MHWWNSTKPRPVKRYGWFMCINLVSIVILSSENNFFLWNFETCFSHQFLSVCFDISSFATKTSDLLSLIIFMHLLCCSIIIAFNLILLEASDRIDFQVMASLYIMLSETALNFLFCFLSERITAALSKIGFAFYESLWLHLPTRQQKLLALTIARSQQDFYYEGLGIVYCSLETFGRVSCDWNYGHLAVCLINCKKCYLFNRLLKPLLHTFWCFAASNERIDAKVSQLKKKSTASNDVHFQNM